MEREEREMIAGRERDRNGQRWIDGKGGELVRGEERDGCEEWWGKRETTEYVALCFPTKIADNSYGGEVRSKNWGSKLMWPSLSFFLVLQLIHRSIFFLRGRFPASSNLDGHPELLATRPLGNGSKPVDSCSQRQLALEHVYFHLWFPL